MRKMHYPVFIMIFIFSVIFASCTMTTDKMPYKISAEEVFDPILHYDRDPFGRDPYYKEHTLEEASAKEIISLLNNSTEIERVEFAGTHDAYLTLDFKGGGIIAIYPAADEEHIFFNRNGTKNYKAQNPALAEYITEQAQSLTNSEAEKPETSEEIPVPGPAMAQSAYYESMDELVQRSTFIFIGKVENVTCKKIAEYKNKTHSEVTIKEAIKGSLTPNETVTVTQTGGYASGYDMVIMENGRRVPYPSTDTEYLFFLTDKKAPMNHFIGFSKIEDGTVYPDEDNNIITKPTPLEDVKQWITESMTQTTVF